MAGLSLIAKEDNTLEILKETDFFSALGNVNAIDDEIIIKGRHYVFSSLNFLADGKGFLSFEAKEPIQKFDCVTIDGFKASSSNTANREKVIGLSLENTNAGFAGKVLENGTISNPLWNWNTGDVLFLNGTILSKIAPSIGFRQIIAKAVNTTTILIHLSETILL
jgi:hypothetical protein